MSTDEQSKVKLRISGSDQSVGPASALPDEVQLPPTQVNVQAFDKPKKRFNRLLILIALAAIVLILSIGVGDEGTKILTGLRAMYASFGQAIRNRNAVRIEAIDTPYDIYSRAGRQAVAIDLRKEFSIRALIEAEKEKGQYSFLRLCALSQLYHVSIVAEDWDEAEHYAELLEKNQFALNGSRDPVLADAYCMRASACFKRNQLKRAFFFSNRAIAIYKRACDPGSIRFKKIDYMEAGKGKEPFECSAGIYDCHVEPRQTWQQLPAPHYKQLATVAQIPPDTQDFSKAEQFFKEAIEIGKRNEKSGCDLQCTATIMNDYACLLRRAGRPAEAKVLEEKVDRIRLQHYGILPPLN